MHRKTQIKSGGLPEKEAILAALAHELFGRALTLPTEPDWNAVLAESVSQAVFPLVYNALRSRLPEEIKAKWETVFLQNLASNIRVIAAHSELHTLLEENSVPYVILKGCASGRYYPRPELRTMGDVDFLIDPPELERCSAVVEQFGMRRIDDGTHNIHRTFSFRHVDYEMHWRVTGIPEVGGEHIQACFRNIRADAVCHEDASGRYNVPSDYHHGLVLLLHTASHLTTTGIGLRHLCDWAVFAEGLSDEGFRKSFEASLKDIGLWELAKILTRMSVRSLQASPKQWAADVDDALADSLMEDIWRGGNFGGKDPQRKSYSVLMTDVGTHKIENRSVLSALASAIDRKAKLYHPRLAASVVFRPAAWAAVCWRYSWLALTRKRPWLKFGEDTKTAQQRKELFSQLKLFEE